MTTSADEQQPPRRPWTARRVAYLLAPGLIYLGIREFGLLVLAWMSFQTRFPMGQALTSWDADWYLGIAAGGYDNVPARLVDAYSQRNPETPLAFFPGYPKLINYLAVPLGSTSGARLFVAFAITIVAGVFCAYALARIGRRVPGGSSKVGLILVALFAAAPMSVVLVMPYSEALFCAFAAWSLVGVLERNWLLAGLACACAGLVRPTAAALVLAVGLATLVAVIKRQDGWRPWVGGLLVPLGFVGYLGWVATRTGELLGYFKLQDRGWDSRFDGGIATARFMVDSLSRQLSVFEGVTIVVIIAAVALVVIGFRMKMPWPLMVYALGVLVMDLGSNGLMASKARLLMPAFVLLIPIAIGLARRQTATVLATLTGLAVVTSWFGAYSLTVWSWAI
nr:integral membrane protein [Kibdelosporangium sp. MJ126-NF4]CTQ94309.1 integral membrane protein [Kibdelosporangium sp. MJ126-NF4]